MRPILKVALLSIAFSIGGGFIASSIRDKGLIAENMPAVYGIEPVAFSFGLAICLISGVVLLKAIREYLAESKD